MRAAGLKQTLEVHEATFAALGPRMAAASQQQQHTNRSVGGSDASPARTSAAHGAQHNVVNVKSPGAGSAEAGAPAALNTGALDAALKAVGLAQFALVQGIHREIQRLSHLFLSGKQEPQEPHATGAAAATGAGASAGAGQAAPPATPSAPTAGSTPGQGAGSGTQVAAAVGAAQAAPAAAAGGRQPGDRGDRGGRGPSRAFKLGEYQLKQLRNGDVYKVRHHRLKHAHARDCVFLVTARN